MEEPPGSFHICEVCNWEDDRVQLADPRYGGGANIESLVEAQRAALQRFPLDMQLVDGFQRDREWRPVREDDHFDGSDGYYWKK